MEERQRKRTKRKGEKIGTNGLRHLLLWLVFNLLYIVVTWVMWNKNYINEKITVPVASSFEQAVSVEQKDLPKLKPFTQFVESREELLKLTRPDGPMLTMLYHESVPVNHLERIYVAPSRSSEGFIGYKVQYSAPTEYHLGVWRWNDTEAIFGRNNGGELLGTSTILFVLFGFGGAIGSILVACEKEQKLLENQQKETSDSSSSSCAGPENSW